MYLSYCVNCPVCSGVGGLQLDDREHCLRARPPAPVQLHHLGEGRQRPRREQPRLRRRQDGGPRTVPAHRRRRQLEAAAALRHRRHPARAHGMLLLNRDNKTVEAKPFVYLEYDTG